VEQSIEDSALDLIRLVAPTTDPRRMGRALDGAQGFVYLIARLGVTGASTSLAVDLGASVARVRSATTLPIAVGFGVSTPRQACAVAQLADGVVIGSALVDVLGQHGVAALARLLSETRAALDGQ
ncbi:MAG: tryptophan synthase subunit alpha, partial [Gemmatimonadales bacterium]